MDSNMPWQPRIWISDQNGDPTNCYRTVCPCFEFSTETLSLKPVNKQNIYNNLILKHFHLLTGLDVCSDEDMKGKTSSRLLTLGRVEGFSETRTAFIFWPSESCPSISTMWSSSFVLGSTQAWSKEGGEKACHDAWRRQSKTRAGQLKDSGCFMCNRLFLVPNHDKE